LASEFRATDWDRYRMDYRDSFRALESIEEERRVTGQALACLQEAGILPGTDYDEALFSAFRKAVKDTFEIPWTAITPRMQRLLYAINAIHRPQTTIAAGVFCGNTFISNAGAAVGPGGCYVARELVGLEIKVDEAVRAERNVRRLDPTGVARIVAADAVAWVKAHPGPIDLLYLDADGDKGRGKGIYLEILEAAWDRLPRGAVILAHNSVNCAGKLTHYLAFVRDPKNCAASVNVIVDPEGLEVTCR